MPSSPWLDLLIAPNMSQGAVRLEFDVARRFNGDRSTFGGVLKLPVELSRDLPGTPLMLAGTLRLTGETEGLSIPAQTMLVNENTIRIPISDEQLARLEDKRLGKAPMFELFLRGIGTVDGSIVILNSHHPVNLPVPLEEWLKVLDQLGFGKRRLIELPPAPARAGKTWAAAAAQIQEASRRLSKGDSGGAMLEARNALQRTLEAAGESIGRPQAEKEAFTNFGKALAAGLRSRHVDRSDDPHAVLADAVTLAISTFGFGSDPGHTSLTNTERVHAELAISVATALYTYFACTLK
jgi:hypothetical protein